MSGWKKEYKIYFFLNPKKRDLKSISFSGTLKKGDTMKKKKGVCV